ncbi:Mce family protein [Nocardia brasiliensis]|uniref:Mce family protein n=1 Tax=Nocardia brasiliensis TaxID=37326 RepID=A0A6G9XTU3_NOCBR|nr:Mce family protein [Nocardia brasiliensis]QIS04339.1 Mce family protein [Nocardia brasiliensis]
MRMQLRTSHIGEGIVAGAGVRLNGVVVGRITDVDSTPGGTQLITLAVDRSQLFGLSDSVQVEYAPANLFGISEIVLRRRPGGAELHEGAVVDLTAAGRVNDVTMGSLLRLLSQNSLTVLTPQLTDMLTRLGTDLQAFAPLIEAMVGVSRAVADTQRYPASFLTEQYAAFLDGVANFGDGFVKLINEVYHIDVLRNDRARFDVGVGLVVDQLFPELSRLFGTADRYLGGYSDAVAVLLGQLARTVPDPDRSHAELSELIDRLDRTFGSTPDGPQVGVDILMRAVPGIAVPLLGGAIPTSVGGGR